MHLSRREFLQRSGLAATASAMGLWGSCSPSKEAGPPNVVVIFSDELAPEYLSCYGGAIPTPNLDKLAARGVRFTSAYAAAPMCTPSRYGLLTGQLPARCSHPAFLRENPPETSCNIAWNTDRT